MAPKTDDYLLVGQLHKKRGGLGRHAKAPWQPRTFALSGDGILSYFETSALEKKRSSLNLLSARAVLSTSEVVDEAPTAHVLIVAHDRGQRWKLCAPTADALENWRSRLAPFCRVPSSGARAGRGRAAGGGPGGGGGGARPAVAAAAAAAPPFASPSARRLADRRGLLARAARPPRPRAAAPSTVAIAAALVVAELAALASRGGASAASLAALLVFDVYALLVLTRRDADREETATTLLLPPATMPKIRSDWDVLADGGRAAAAPTKLEPGGTGLGEVPFDATGACPCGTWSKAPGSTFKIRQLGYKKSKRKAPSGDSFYEVVSVDLFDTEARLGDVASLLDLPAPARPSPDPHVPAIWVINAQIPSETGPVRASIDADGHGYCMCIVVQLTAQTAKDLEDLAAGRPLDDPARAAPLRLLRAYCKVAPDEPRLSAVERGRFKVLAQIRNIDEVNIPSFAKGYNGKPALINKTGTLTRSPSAPNDWFNMDINVHAFGYMARSGLQSIFRDFQDFILTVGFVLEGRADSELPECMLAAFDLNHVDYNMATPL